MREREREIAEMLLRRGKPSDSIQDLSTVVEETWRLDVRAEMI